MKKNIKRGVYRVLKNFKFLPKSWHFSIRYYYHSGKNLNLNNPVEFNEKIIWLKNYFHVPILTQLADKYSVREYVKEKIGEEYLVKLFAVYERAKNLKLNKLPQTFIMKGVRGSKTNLIVEDKNLITKKKLRKKINKFLKRDHYSKGGYEWAYKNIKPRVVVEELLTEPNKKFLTDYKIYCFSGKPEFIQVISDIDDIKAQTYFNTDWDLQEFTKSKKKHRLVSIPKPKNFEVMLDLAEKLADKFPFVRVDFYNIEGKIYFGEMTFYPADGRTEFYPDSWNKHFGDKLILPMSKGKQEIITIF